jgi:AraC family transcriptional regulator of arabinose operon
MDKGERMDAPVSLGRPLGAGKTVLKGSPAKDIYRTGGMDGWILNMTVEGKGVVRNQRDSFSVFPGDLVFWQPRVIHWYGNEAEQRSWTHLWAYFFPREGWMELLRWPERIGKGIGTISVRDPEAAKAVERAFSELIETINSVHPRRLELSMSLLEAFLWRCDPHNPESMGRRVDFRVQRAQEYLSRNYHRPIAVEDLARLANLSVSRFAHLFREETGMAPARFLEERRIRAARDRLVLTSESVSDIAFAIGYGDPSYFSRIFKRISGKTPQSFRKDGS